MDLKSRIRAELDRHTVCTLATVDTEGSQPLAHAASVLYAHEDLSIFWVSDPQTRHSRHISAQPQIAAAIDRQFDDFEKILGLQIIGRAAVIDDEAEKTKALDLLAARYAFLEQFRSGPEDLTARMAAIEVYCLKPESITLIDNSKGFGHKETLEINW